MWKWESKRERETVCVCVSWSRFRDRISRMNKCHIKSLSYHHWVSLRLIFSPNFETLYNKEIQKLLALRYEKSDWEMWPKVVTQSKSKT